MIKDKRGIESLLIEIIFSVLTLVAIAILFSFVSSKSGDFHLTEQVYAKQIALIIDQSRPGTNASLEISEIFEIAQKNNFAGQTIFIDDENKKVTVKLDEGIGYSLTYFNGARVSGYTNKKTEKFEVEVT